MRIALLGDTHFGVRSDSKEFSNFFRKFYDDVFFPHLEENEIDTVFQLGDLFDRRKYVNFYTLAECRDYFFDKAENKGIHLHVLIGNHDIFWRESLSINSPDLLLKDYNNITIYDKPTLVQFGDKQFDIIPWICKENEKEVLQFMEQSSSDYCLGHFEISGFQMYKGVDNHEGVSADLFKQYEHVYSGHFHHKSTKGNITYVGTPSEHTWADYNDPRGFHVLDTDSGETTFIENPYTIFSKIYYDDTKPVEFDKELVESKYVKLVVVNKTDYYKFDQFVEKIYASNPIEFKINEDFSEFEDSNIDEDEMNVEDTFTLLTDYVDNLDTDADKQRIKVLMKTLFVEAQHWGDE